MGLLKASITIMFLYDKPSFSDDNLKIQKEEGKQSSAVPKDIGQSIGPLIE